MDGAQFLIAPNNNPAHKRRLDKVRRRYSPAKLAKSMELMEEVAIEAAIGTILLDFRGVTSNGQPLEFNESTARELLKIEPIRSFLFGESQDIENFQRESEAADTADLKSGPEVGA